MADLDHYLSWVCVVSMHVYAVSTVVELKLGKLVMRTEICPAWGIVSLNGAP